MTPMKRMDPKEQFSKKLATWTARFWFLFMLIAAAICVWVPGAADAAVYLAICASVIMLINVWAYTRNSVYEKAILAGMEKAKFGLTWKRTEENPGDEPAENDPAENDPAAEENG